MDNTLLGCVLYLYHVSLSAVEQSLEEQLQAKEGECVVLDSSLAETKRKSQLDRDLLKRAAKQHKERAVESLQTVGTLGTQLQLAVSIAICTITVHNRSVR